MTDGSDLPINREMFLELRERVSVLEECKDALLERTERLAGSLTDLTKFVLGESSAL